MKPFRCRPLLMLAAIPLVGVCGCSYGYELYLQGLLVAGPNQAPVEGATITLFAGRMDYAACSTTKQGRWALKHSLSDGEFWPDASGKEWLGTDSQFPYSIRIEVDGRTFVIPCPKVAAPESGKDISAFVLAVLDADDVDLAKSKHERP